MDSLSDVLKSSSGAYQYQVLSLLKDTTSQRQWGCVDINLDKTITVHVQYCQMEIYFNLLAY